MLLMLLLLLLLLFEKVIFAHIYVLIIHAQKYSVLGSDRDY